MYDCSNLDIIRCCWLLVNNNRRTVWQAVYHCCLVHSTPPHTPHIKRDSTPWVVFGGGELQLSASEVQAFSWGLVCLFVRLAIFDQPLHATPYEVEV